MQVTPSVVSQSLEKLFCTSSVLYLPLTLKWILRVEPIGETYHYVRGECNTRVRWIILLKLRSKEHSWMGLLLY